MDQLLSLQQINGGAIRVLKSSDTKIVLKQIQVRLTDRNSCVPGVRMLRLRLSFTNTCEPTAECIGKETNLALKLKGTSPVDLTTGVIGELEHEYALLAPGLLHGEKLFLRMQLEVYICRTVSLSSASWVARSNLILVLYHTDCL